MTGERERSVAGRNGEPLGRLPLTERGMGSGGRRPGPALQRLHHQHCHIAPELWRFGEPLERALPDVQLGEPAEWGARARAWEAPKPVRSIAAGPDPSAMAGTAVKTGSGARYGDINGVLPVLAAASPALPCGSLAVPTVRGSVRGAGDPISKPLTLRPHCAQHKEKDRARHRSRSRSSEDSSPDPASKRRWMCVSVRVCVCVEGGVLEVERWG